MVISKPVTFWHKSEKITQHKCRCLMAAVYLMVANAGALQPVKGIASGSSLMVDTVMGIRKPVTFWYKSV